MTACKLIEQLRLPPSASIRDAARVIQNHPIKFVLVCDDLGRLIGTVTDGDIRRSVLAGLDYDAPIEKIMNRHPQVTRQHENRIEIRAQMRNSIIRHLPELDAEDRVVDIFFLDGDEGISPLPNTVVLMAGGRGERLRPLTESTPKPLLKIGDKPVLEKAIENLVAQGFSNFLISVNYLGHMIEDYFGDGRRLGIKIDYLHEDGPLGTAGALAGLDRQERPFAVMNGDLLTGANVREMVGMCRQGVKAVVGAREYAYTVPYGCLSVDHGRITSIEEKPTVYHFISAGVYVLAPETLDYIANGMYLDMPDLFRKMIEEGGKVCNYHITEEWIDIGSKEDLAWARRLYAGDSDD